VCGGKRVEPEDRLDAGAGKRCDIRLLPSYRSHLPGRMTDPAQSLQEHSCLHVNKAAPKPADVLQKQNRKASTALDRSF